MAAPAPDDLSVFWYTYSTISQTLASAFGFLVAVCLYQLQALGTSLSGRMSAMRNWPNSPTNSHIGTSLLYGGTCKEFRDLVKQHGHSDSHVRVAEKARRDREFEQFCANIEAMDVINQAIRGSLHITTVTIICSIVFMSLTNYRFISNFNFASIMLFPTVALSILCLASYVLLALAVTWQASAIKRLKGFWDRLPEPPDPPGGTP
jgi:ABC-type glycerol-3-phosphate transport system permease component